MITRRQFISTTSILGTGIISSNGIGGIPIAETSNATRKVLKIAFGSCNRQDLSQKYWLTIAKENPDIWIWLGDSIYADYFTESLRRSAYNSIKNNKYYKTLSEYTSIIGTWDDHDYAFNNAGIDFHDKEGSKSAFLDFIGEPRQSERRSRSGIYTSELFGHENQQIEIILLDLRSFRPEEDSNADLLGASQWAWLESKLSNDQPKVRIIGSSIQFLTDYKKKDAWANFPASRQRMLDLLAGSQVPTIFISGDRHLAEFSRLERNESHPIYDITSSGLTHSSDHSNKNKHRVGNQHFERNFGVLTFNWTNENQIGSVIASVHNPDSGEIISSMSCDF